MSKKKGSRTERELFHMLFKHEWVVVRSAGSGSTPLPNPDLLAGKHGRVLAIECKSGTGKNRRYIDHKQINELLTFSKGFGAEPWVGIRYDGQAWKFLKPHQLGRSAGKNRAYYVDASLLALKGITFEDLTTPENQEHKA